MASRCDNCEGQLKVLETFCTDPYSRDAKWYRDVKKKCICDNCGNEQEITTDTVRQAKWFK